MSNFLHFHSKLVQPSVSELDFDGHGQVIRAWLSLYDVQNFIYAFIQLVHNFGAVTVAGTAASALWLVRGDAAMQRRLALFIGWAWAIQVVSGVLFGMTTFYFEGQLPDIHGIAMIALLDKAMCASAGLLLAVIYLKSKSRWSASQPLLVWRLSFILGALALSSAAFLR